MVRTSKGLRMGFLPFKHHHTLIGYLWLVSYDFTLFFSLQFGQWFLSFPLLSTLINSAAPVSLYSCERMEWSRLKKLLKCMSLIVFTLSCAEQSIGGWMLDQHLGFVPLAWGSRTWVRTPLGTNRPSLQASSGGHSWGHSSTRSLQAFEFPPECLVPLTVGSGGQAVQCILPGFSRNCAHDDGARLAQRLLNALVSVCFFQVFVGQIT